MILSVWLLVLPLSAQLFDKAFSTEPDVKTTVKYDEGVILFHFSVDPDYHITDLKNGFFTIGLGENEFVKIKDVAFPRGVAYADEMVFKGKFDVTVRVESLKESSAPVKLNFKVGYQVCQERPQELCYAPESKDVAVEVAGTFKSTGETGVAAPARAHDESFSQWVERIVKQELEKGSILLFLLVFVAGFLTSLTPCVYPVIPIVMGYIGTRSGKKKLKGLYLSLFFVLGLALVYSILGVIAAATGSMIGASFQNPLVVIVVSAVFIVMGFSLAGLFDIPVPAAISSKVQGSYKSEVIGSIIIGGVSAIIAAPCVGPVLIALLSWISQTRNIVLGFWMTFTFSLGMGVIFILVGTFTGVISSMPRAGKWMSIIKYFFATLLMGVGFYFLFTVIPKWSAALIMGLFFIFAGIFLALYRKLSEKEFAEKLYPVVVILILLIGLNFIVNSALSLTQPAPDKGTIGTGTVIPKLPWIMDLEEGKRLAALENKPLMIDTYADWCVACKELDRFTFSQAEVRQALKEFVLVKLDFTAKSNENDALRKSLNVIGMPTIIFLNPGGDEINRFSGFKDKKEFLKFLETLSM